MGFPTLKWAVQLFSRELRYASSRNAGKSEKRSITESEGESRMHMFLCHHMNTVLYTVTRLTPELGTRKLRMTGSVDNSRNGQN